MIYTKCYLSISVRLDCFVKCLFRSTTVVLVILQRPVSSGKKITPNQVCFVSYSCIIVSSILCMIKYIIIPILQFFIFLVVQNWQACFSVNNNKPDMAGRSNTLWCFEVK